MTDYVVTGMKQKNEPLKLNFRNYVCTNGIKHNEKVCDYDEAVLQIKSAVEWLREKLSKLTQSENHVDKLEVVSLINEAFPDLCSSGDLIADKQNPQDNDKYDKRIDVIRNYTAD